MANLRLLSNDDLCNLFEQAENSGIPITEALAGKNLTGVNLSGNDLNKFNLSGTNLNGADLSNTNLNGAKLQDAYLRGVNLTKATLCGANLTDANLNGADLRRADLRGANLRRANLSNTNLSNTDFNGTDVKDAKFDRCSGLVSDIQCKLQNQGADFGNSINCSKTLLGKDLRWWLQFIIVPLLIAIISSGGIASIIEAFQDETNSPLPNETASPTSEVEK